MPASLLRSRSSFSPKAPSSIDQKISLNDGKNITTHNDSILKRLRATEDMPAVCEMLSELAFESLNYDDLAWKTFGVDVCIQKISEQEHNNLISLVCEGDYVDHLLRPAGSLIPKLYVHFSNISDHFIMVQAVGSLVRDGRFSDVILIEEDYDTEKTEKLNMSMSGGSRDKLKVMFAQDIKWLISRKMFGYTLFIGVVRREEHGKSSGCFHIDLVGDDSLGIAMDCWFWKYSDCNQYKSTTCTSYGKLLVKQLGSMLNKVEMVSSQPCSVLLSMDTLSGLNSDQLLEHVQRYTEMHLSGDAVAVLRKARRVYETEGHTASVSSVIDVDPRAVSAVEDETLFKDLLEDIASPLWKLHGKSRGCSISTDPCPGKHNRFRCESIADLDVLSCLAVSNEMADYKLWMPGIDTSEVIHMSSPLQRIGRISGWKPWPLGTEEMMISAIGGVLDGQDLLGRDLGYGTGVLIHLSPAGSEWPKTPNVRDIDLTGGYWFEPLGENKTKIVFVADVDAHIHVPQVMQNWIMANISYLILPMQFRQAKCYLPNGSLHHKISDSSYAGIRRDCELMIQNLTKRTDVPIKLRKLDTEKQVGDGYRVTSIAFSVFFLFFWVGVWYLHARLQVQPHVFSTELNCLVTS